MPSTINILILIFGIFLIAYGIWKSESQTRKDLQANNDFFDKRIKKLDKILENMKEVSKEDLLKEKQGKEQPPKRDYKQAS